MRAYVGSSTDTLTIASTPSHHEADVGQVMFLCFLLFLTDIEVRGEHSTKAYLWISKDHIYELEKQVEGILMFEDEVQNMKVVK